MRICCVLYRLRLGRCTIHCWMKWNHSKDLISVLGKLLKALVGVHNVCGIMFHNFWYGKNTMCRFHGACSFLFSCALVCFFKVILGSFNVCHLLWEKVLLCKILKLSWQYHTKCHNVRNTMAQT